MHGSPKSTTPRGTPSRRGKSPRIASPPNSSQPSAPPQSETPSNSTDFFFSCLSIPVEGAIPIGDEETKVTPSPPPTEPASSTGEPKRTPRKSKIDALVALNNHAMSSSDDNDEYISPTNLAEKYRDAKPIPTDPILDLSTVRTTAPRHFSHPKSTPRPFGLEDCPEFYPTDDEFRDPMAYISSISEKAKKYGICKIVPPEGWQMPFMTDTERFRFKTRLQRLNNIEASSRAKLNFLEQLYRFHKQQGNPRVVVPTINQKPVDLWLLRKEVQKLGGYEAVNKARKWIDIGRAMGYIGLPTLPSQLRNAYTRVILPYEHFCERGRSTPTSPPRASQNRAQVNGTPGKSTQPTQNGGDISAPSSPLTARSSPLSEPPDESESKEQVANARPRRSTRRMSQVETPKKTAVEPTPLATPVFHDSKPEPEVKGKDRSLDDAPCEICGKLDNGTEMLLCDGCDLGFHMFCLDPPLESVPVDEWYCHPCLTSTGGDFGFDEGEEHSLSSFQARDKEFRQVWFRSHPPPSSAKGKKIDDPTASHFGDVTVTEYDVENEFWRLVQSPDETVEVEYGADIHSTTHGSAMPTLETFPLNPYAKDSWNLNNIPVLSESLLRYIKSDISGMTVPWTYVGMTFSTFCWHNEDHYTYSVNFMHWGETKTWYGVPGEDAEKFEAAIQYEAPDLFELQPDLLFQLVTLMNPKRLIDSDVRVYACNQRAGEFVLTFPKAYHAGFNHGLNFNEAVNFALPDWLTPGRDCVQRYRAFRKLPVFSHDELLITITEHSSSIKTALWLTDSLSEMTEREMEVRKKARAMGLKEVLDRNTGPQSEEQYQCNVCKVFCYLSQVTCSHWHNRVVCVDHANFLCDKCDPGSEMTLRIRFGDQELLELRHRFAERAGVPSVWQSKLRKLLMESPRPPLRSLKALLAEGDRINLNYNLPEIYTLRKCVNRATEWVEAANSFTLRKQGRKRPRRSRGRMAQNDMEECSERPDKTLDDLHALLKEVEHLGFDCPEIGTLRNLSQQAEELKASAVAILSLPSAEREKDDFMQKCQNLVLDASSLNVLIDEVVEVEKIVDREQLIKELEEKLEDSKTTLNLDEVRHYVGRARQCNLSSEHEYVKTLDARLREGSSWEKRAKNLLAQPVKTIEDLEEFANLDNSVPLEPSVVDRILAALDKAKEYERIATSWLRPEPGTSKPRPMDVMKLTKRASEFSIVRLQEAQSRAKIAQELEEQSDQVLKGHYPRGANEDLFKSIQEWKVYATEHLLSIFSLPSFEKLEAQVKAHEQWLTNLPWYCTKHQTPHSSTVLGDVMDSTHPDDDQPPNDEYFTCICFQPVRPPPPGSQSDAVQCDHCFARFHGECAKNGGSCPFCDHHHWNGEIRKDRNYHFCFLPSILANAPDITKRYSEEWRNLETIVNRVDRLSTVIGQFLAYTSQSSNQHPTYIHQVRHYMRKLYKIQFAVSPHPDISYGLDLAGLHRILAGRPKKKRKPKIVFGQDVDQDWADKTRCICRGRTSYLLHYPSVACTQCDRLYHSGCVFYPTESRIEFICPLCCLRRNKPYKWSEVRVTPPASENPPSNRYVNIKEMLDSGSQDVIYMSLPNPYMQTLFVELIEYAAGQPETIQHIAQYDHLSQSRPPPTTHQAPLPQSAPTIQHSPSSSQVPPPPWSRWGTVATPSRPPSTQRRQTMDIPHPSRKRKHPEDPEESHHPASSLPTESTSKRRAVLPPPAPQAHTHTSVPPPPVQSSPVQTQTLSPSLAKLMSPVDQVSPRPLYGASPHLIARNGHESHSSSPLMRNGGVEILNSPPMHGLGDSPRLPPIRNNHEVVRSGQANSPPPIRTGSGTDTHNSPPVRKMMMSPGQ
ncbi:hypothetical protein K435DRAFT_824791 [Dendrothele bispora CBS 962.96]|uniref:[histone H3]-trimethyl-L-lysine(4) demethylase n=1 Tax=Dendrothele bispora (strain CBS 962.96) TaxID=1314807 RepID=A0A4S8MXU0_DENBC|nr:hypothetical protein K435DRAFT_824791 [Dendrothele bispora CBS 962.96]